MDPKIACLTLAQVELRLSAYVDSMHLCNWIDRRIIDDLLDRWNVVYWEEKFLNSQGYRSYWK